tara:strand:+ start:404 stop:880 length:477 start_codon:yes stop_codon:yes gene_type:complete
MKKNLLLSILSIFLISCTIKNEVENKHIPEIVDMDNNEVFLDSYKDNVLILNLWATWCKPCIAEFKSLEESKTSYEGKKVKIVAISNEDLDKIVEFIDKRKINLEFLKLNADLNYFNAYSLPTTIVFDKEGKEKFRIASGIDFASKNFINKIIDLEKL